MKSPTPIRLYVSPTGNDRWSGRSPQQPFATIARAQAAARRLKQCAAVRVELRGGVYVLKKPLVFRPADSGAPSPRDEWGRDTGPHRHVTWAAYRNEKPILSGGRRITGWRETEVNGRRAWVTRIGGKFTQLWVNTRRAQRTRLPKRGYFRGATPPASVYKNSIASLFHTETRFKFLNNDLAAWRNVRDIEFVALHFWIESRIPFASINSKTREARLQWKPRMRLTDDHQRLGVQYYVENVFEALDEPGQWYHDRSRGELYYLPLPGEKITTVEAVAPRLKQLMVVEGEHLHFEGLTFSHSEWTPGEEKHTATPQAACHIPGAISFRRARECSLRNCAVTHIGSYGVECIEGCSDVALQSNRITDLAGGGVKIWHSWDTKAKAKPGVGPDTRWTNSCRRVIVADNEIADGGHRWRQAVGVLVGKCSGNQILRNHIHDLDYSGISVGWTWGYAESFGYGNIIEHNHIHDIGRGVLSDMGGIYLLGVAPGTRVRFNRIHDIESRGYGGWGIYLDEGSAYVLVENNLVYRTKSQGFHQHYGRENIIRNNIFAFGREGQFMRSRLENHVSFHFTRNVVIGDGTGQMAGGAWNEARATVDHNLYFAKGGQKLHFAGKTLAAWRKLGLDRHSLVADPLLDKKFRLSPRSPARKIGFVPFAVNP